MAEGGYFHSMQQRAQMEFLLSVGAMSDAIASPTVNDQRQHSAHPSKNVGL